MREPAVVFSNIRRFLRLRPRGMSSYLSYLWHGVLLVAWLRRATPATDGSAIEPRGRAEWRSLKQKQKSSRLSSPLFLLKNGSCRVSLLAFHISPCQAAF